LTNFSKWPVGYLIPLVVAGSLVYLLIAERRKNDKGAFLASCAYIVGMLVGAAFALYPVVLPASTDPNLSLTIYNTAAGAHGLSVGFVWWSIGMLLVVGYFVFIYRMFRGKVRVEAGGDGHGY
jgi:cytochrome d ubiquinol oxidase subunit II